MGLFSFADSYLPGYHFVTLFTETCIVFFTILSFTPSLPLYYINYLQGSGTVFYVSYIHSRTLYVVPNGKSLKRQFHQYQILKIDLQGYRNKAMISLKHIRKMLSKATLYYSETANPIQKR